MILPPGTVLQLMYVKERLRSRPAGSFVEVGVGEGALSRLLLGLGWRGVGFDLNPDAVAHAASTNADAVAEGRYETRAGSWLDADGPDDVELVISSMVIEHLSDEDEARYWARTRQALAPGGLASVLVPSSPRHWGIEDEIAGHFRRYTAEGLRVRLEGLGWKVVHQAGLTYPLSNVLLPLSNALVRRAEGAKTSLTLQQRTEKSGIRDVRMKTRFPSIARLVLNERSLYPMHLAQKAASRNSSCLVLYTEARPR